MFRRLSSSLPKDPEFPADLEKLGYAINEKDQIRSIAHQDQEFNFFISKNERVKETQREAMNACIRREINHRFQASGLNITRLPIGTPPSEPHVPILTSPDIATAKRLMLYIGEAAQDLGVFAYRIIGQESISSGSALDFIHDVQNGKDGKDIGIMVANPGQLLWYRRGQRAMTMESWNGLPRKTGVSDPMRIDPVKNYVPGNKDVQHHVANCFDAIAELAIKDVKIDIAAVGEGAECVARYLDQNWERWESNIQAMCVGVGFLWRMEQESFNEKFMQFWSRRTRAYLIHGDPADTLLDGREYLCCNCYSSGEPTFAECIMPRAYKCMLKFFQDVQDVPGYFEAQFDPLKDEDGMAGVVNSDDNFRNESPPAA